MKISLITLIAFLFSITAAFSQELDEDVLKMWWQKDLELDSIPGIGLERTYKELIKGKKGEEVIVAVLDTKIDIDHEDLKSQIWINEDEIPNNGIDDDDNGYVDDTNGWNFLGNSKGEDTLYQFSEFMRILNTYNKRFEIESLETLKDDEKKLYLSYQKAKKEFETKRKKALEEKLSSDSLTMEYYAGRDALKKYLEKGFTSEQLDSLGKKDTSLTKFTDLFKDIVAYNISEDDITYSSKYFKEKLDRDLNLSYDENAVREDNVLDFSDSIYGNPVIKGEVPFEHSILVSGPLAAKRNNSKGLEGFSNQIKIMPIVMIATGAHHDKDLFMALKYAVNNGAQIVNMSWGKDYSLQEKYVFRAMKYAEKNDVLLVMAAGNNRVNIDKIQRFPRDYNENGLVVSTTIKSSSHTKKIDSTLVAQFSNYGRSNVDIFAPGAEIYTTNSKNTYRFGKGTSYSVPMVAGTAALLKSYFPELTAIQLKEIILKSGTKLDIMVKRPGDDEGAPLVPFSSLSKTGSILNTYAAFKYAMELKN